jgi:hypothetical protein
MPQMLRTYPEKVRTNPPCPLIPPKRIPSVLQMRAMARGHGCALRLDGPRLGGLLGPAGCIHTF